MIQSAGREQSDALVNRLLRWWQGKRAPEDALPALPRARFRVVCISREAGSGGSNIGKLVAERLGWRFWDRELIQAIAERMGVEEEQAVAFDELPPTRVQAWALPLWEEHYAPHEAYLDHLGKLIDAIGRAGHSVVIGRGAGFALPRMEVLSVRIIAPLPARANRLAERMGVSARTARRMAQDLDRRRNRFAHLQLGVDARAVASYDMVLDSHSLGERIATDLIVRAVECGQPEVELMPVEAPPALPGPD